MKKQRRRVLRTADRGRRRFLKAMPAAVVGGLAAPAIARQAQENQRITKQTLDCAETLVGIDFSDAEQEQALRGANQNLERFEAAPQEYASKAAGHPFRPTEAAQERPRRRRGC